MHTCATQYKTILKHSNNQTFKHSNLIDLLTDVRRFGLNDFSMQTIKYERPFVYPYQQAILDSPARFTVTEAATKVGKTASHIIWLFEQAMACTHGQTVWWVAPVYTQAKIAFNRMRNQLCNDDAGLQNTFFKVNETELSLTLPGGSIIKFKTAEKPDNLYGDDVYAAVFDEFTRAREESWHALRSTLTATGGRCKFIGNVKGKKNWGYMLAQRAKAGEPNYAHFKITAYDAAAAGLVTKDGRPFMEEVKAAKKDLPATVFKELYLAEAADDGTNPFGYAFIQQCTKLLSNMPPVCFGIDLAKTTDYTVIVGLDKSGSVCYFDRFQKDWLQTTNIIKALPQNVPMAIDSTGIGDPIAENISRVMNNVELFKFSSSSKQQIMEGLALAIQSGKITFPADEERMPVNHAGHIKHELENFEFQYTRTGVRYSAPPGLHDDCVCALALARHKYGNGIMLGTYSVW